jgi:glycosyltransferase involved in cell wall biosynthesis
VRMVESIAERRLRLLLAEHGYLERFAQPHPVVPNEPLVPETVPPPGADRVVHLGHLSAARGAAELLDVARLLRPHGVAVELIGPADTATVPTIRAAVRTGLLRWTGFVPNDEALLRVQGALAGLCLLQDAPNYRHSMPTKVLEYMAHGVPVITSPLPLAAETVRRHRCGTVVPFADPEAVARAVLRLREDETGRELAGARGHDAARRLHDWRISGSAFVDLIEGWAAEPGSARSARSLRPSKLVGVR